MMKLEKGDVRQNVCITFMVTMDMAFQMLTRGVLSADEFSRFFDEMEQKYGCEEVRILYQSKLDIFLEQSVNG
ncbi:MAG: hypothetical protein IKG71_07430 [Firmicutes bacterium]|nr:hypothetical protein [Bacillota bacterium]